MVDCLKTAARNDMNGHAFTPHQQYFIIEVPTQSLVDYLYDTIVDEGAVPGR
jgi:hypothetical protein